MALGCQLFDTLPHRHLVEGEAVIVELDITDDMRGPAGTVHGGLVATLVDCAGASAVAHTSGRLVATSSVALNYLSGGRIGPLRARAQTLRVGQHHGVAEVHVHDVGKDRLIASALITLSFLAGESYGTVS
jgi:uncharacterized protein (TIGR00369 family)